MKEYIVSRSYNITDDVLDIESKGVYHIWAKQWFPYTEVSEGDILYWYSTPEKKIICKSRINKLIKREFIFNKNSLNEIRDLLTSEYKSIDKYKNYFGIFYDGSKYSTEKWKKYTGKKGYLFSYQVDILERNLDYEKPVDFSYPQLGWQKVEGKKIKNWVTGNNNEKEESKSKKEISVKEDEIEEIEIEENEIEDEDIISKNIEEEKETWGTITVDWTDDIDINELNNYEDFLNDKLYMLLYDDQIKYIGMSNKSKTIISRILKWHRWFLIKNNTFLFRNRIERQENGKLYYYFNAEHSYDQDKIKIRIGNIHKLYKDKDKSEKQVKDIEAFLIFNYKPEWNTQNTKSYSGKKLKILNKGNFKPLSELYSF